MGDQASRLRGAHLPQLAGLLPACQSLAIETMRAGSDRYLNMNDLKHKKLQFRQAA
jgi:hypothetical protein